MLKLRYPSILLFVNVKPNADQFSSESDIEILLNSSDTMVDPPFTVFADFSLTRDKGLAPQRHHLSFCPFVSFI